MIKLNTVINYEFDSKVLTNRFDDASSFVIDDMTKNIYVVDRGQVYCIDTENNYTIILTTIFKLQGITINNGNIFLCGFQCPIIMFNIQTKIKSTLTKKYCIYNLKRIYYHNNLLYLFNWTTSEIYILDAITYTKVNIIENCLKPSGICFFTNKFLEQKRPVIYISQFTNSRNILKINHLNYKNYISSIQFQHSPVCIAIYKHYLYILVIEFKHNKIISNNKIYAINIKTGKNEYCLNLTSRIHNPRDIQIHDDLIYILTDTKLIVTCIRS